MWLTYTDRLVLIHPAGLMLNHLKLTYVGFA